MKFLSFSVLVLVVLSSSCDKQEEDSYIPREALSQERSNKRGVAFSFQFIEDVTVLSPGTSWSYNWSPTQGSIFDPVVSENQLDFCPMAWNGINEDLLREYVARNPSCKYLLGFNEPNLTDQANMTPAEAAEKWPAVKGIADELNLKLISPAMNYGTLEGYSDPITWLDEFFTLVPLSDVDGIAVHCYMASPYAVKSYIGRFKKYNKPIWFTEFCAWDGLNENIFTPEAQQQYLSDVINYLESDPDIFRYAWFIPRAGGSEDNFPYMFLLKNSASVELTELGNIFVQMSSHDKETYYVEQQQIEAEHYSSTSISEGVGQEIWVTGPQLRITSDAPNESLELYKFLPGQWIEYRIEADRTKDFKLDLRYASLIDADLTISIDGKIVTTHLLQNTGENFIWNISTIPFDLEKGRHVLRISVDKGMSCLNWLKFY